MSEEPRHFAYVLAAALQRQMNVVGGLPEAPFPKNVGLLFFNDGPHRFFPATQIDVVWFPDWGSQDLACHAEQWLAAAGVRN